MSGKHRHPSAVSLGPCKQEVSKSGTKPAQSMKQSDEDKDDLRGLKQSKFFSPEESVDGSLSPLKTFSRCFISSSLRVELRPSRSSSAKLFYSGSESFALLISRTAEELNGYLGEIWW